MLTSRRRSRTARINVSLRGGLTLKRLLTLVCLASLAACGGEDTGTSASTGGTLVVEDLVVGTGATAVAGNTVNVHYLGTLTNGTVFDSSYGGNPLSFRLAAGQVIPGFDQGVTGMKVGGKRRLTIPPSLAYGSAGRGQIPPNATLVFEVELVSIVG
jgi:FKBP-type peptidyl-prolyl cis-trans isomerase